PPVEAAAQEPTHGLSVGTGTPGRVSSPSRLRNATSTRSPHARKLEPPPELGSTAQPASGPSPRHHALRTAVGVGDRPPRRFSGNARLLSCRRRDGEGESRPGHSFRGKATRALR